MKDNKRTTKQVIADQQAINRKLSAKENGRFHHNIKIKDTFIEIQNIVSMQSHENTLFITFEDYENNFVSLDIPVSQIFEWFDKEHMEYIYKTYTNYLKSKL